ncbi:MAG: hypothetical protein RR053_06255 [Evtepia sp.]
MQEIMKAVLPLALAVTVSGCASVNAPPKEQDAQIAQQEITLGDGMLQSLRRECYSDFTKDFSAELKAGVSEIAFKKLNSDLATRKESISQWRLMDSLNRGDIYRTEVWKLVLTKDTKSGKSNIERLFYVTKADLDGKTVVIGFKFDAFF